jgi:diguanylate cyclase (GGDEF)-like protein/PAS domain S-box-containing protein
MDYIKAKDIDISKKTKKNWQEIVDIIAELTDVTASLIMKVEPPYMKVFRSSKSKNNPYNVGDKKELSGLYCEEVIKTDEKLLVSNALKVNKWKNNSDIKLGMISYLGFPIKWPDGDFFGTICVLDTEENKFNKKTVNLIKQFKKLIEAELKNIYQKKNLKEEIAKKEKSEKKLSTILHSIGDGVITTDENGRIDIMNSTAEKITGYKLEEVKGDKLEDVFKLVNSLSGESVNSPVEEVLATGKIVNMKADTTLIDKNGHIYQIADSAAPIQEMEGKIQGVVLVFSDISRDNLTGLYNNSFMEEIIRRWDDKKQLPISIIMIDINGLKLVNDGYGHKQGDKLLIKTAELLLACVTNKGFVARWGGDDFIVLLPRTKEAKARELSHEIAAKSGEIMLNDEINLSLGIGTSTKIDSEQDIYKILHSAEDEVLMDKLTREKSARNLLLKNMLKTLGAKSFETKEHAERMERLSVKLGEKIGLSREKLNHLSLLASLHDIGKINIDEEILKKPSALTSVEWETIKKHPEKGFAIAHAIEEFVPVAESIRSHHERWDGTGYPQGLEGVEIPFLARIISIVDAYDVMINGRSYKKAISQKEAIQELIGCSGSQFDPELVEAFVGIISD